MKYKSSREILNKVFDSSDEALKLQQKTEGEVLNMVYTEDGTALKVRVTGLVDSYSKTETDTLLADKAAVLHNHDADYVKKSDVVGAYGNLDSPLLHLPLKKSLLTAQGQSVCTFTRASAATYVDRYGMLKSVAADIPRFTADGLLIEGASTNLLTYSEQFDNAVWVKYGATVTANTTAVTDPYGTNLADKLVEDTTTSSHRTYQVFATTIGNKNSRSVFLKSGERDRAYIHSYNGSVNIGAYFDLSAGTVISTDPGVTAVISALANGWYRCVITTTETAVSERIQIQLVNSGTTTVYAGDGSSGLYIFGAQLEAMPFATSYIPTTSTSVTRAAEKCSLPLQDNMVKLQKSTGHTFIVDATVPIDSSAKIALGGDGSETRHLVGFYNTQVYTNNARGGRVDNALAGIDSLKKHRYAVVFTGSASAVYVDGIYKGSATNTYTAELASTIYVGSAYDSRQLFGTISNLRIYDCALTAEEVRLA